MASMTFKLFFNLPNIRFSEKKPRFVGYTGFCGIVPGWQAVALMSPLNVMSDIKR